MLSYFATLFNNLIKFKMLMNTKFKSASLMLIFFFMINIMGLFAQNITLTGNVSDDNNEPLIGVNVVQKGTTNGTVTDFDGNFSLQVPNGSVIVFSYIGFLPQELTATDTGIMNVTLSEDTGMLDELVVVGYGTQSRYTLTTSIGQYSGEKMEGSPVNSIGDNLKGKVSGLRVATTSMEPGANPRFLIRGGSSINQSNDPIIMVDGVQCH